jgi:hypothetical protein
MQLLKSSKGQEVGLRIAGHNSFINNGRFEALKMRNSSRSQAEEMVEAAKQKVGKLVKDVRPQIENGLEELQRTTSRTYQRLDSEYDITDRTQRATRRMKETAVDIDQTYGVRRRIRRAADWFERSKPAWGRKFEELTSTNTGKAIVVGATFLLMTTPIFWKVR